MIAIYARQSVERPDSISIAMQVEHCRRICPAEAEVRVFTDRGFTGTNTHRPAFREMLGGRYLLGFCGKFPCTV